MACVVPNLYGNWCEVMWNNRHYYVNKNDLSFNEYDIKDAESNEEWKEYRKFFK